jgi:hypothetical protein
MRLMVGWRMFGVVRSLHCARDALTPPNIRDWLPVEIIWLSIRTLFEETGYMNQIVRD